MGSTPDRWSQWLTDRRDGGDDAQRRATLEWLGPIRDRVLNGAGDLDGATVLDVGCGDGLIGLAALERVGPSGAVVFADVSPALLEHAEDSARRLGLRDRARFVTARAEDLSAIEDHSVDVVTTRSVLIYVADKPGALQAIRRVLRPGGRVSLFEPINTLMYPEPQDRLWGYDVAGVVDLADRVKDGYRRLEGSATRSMIDFDDRDLVRYAVAAGFPEVRLILELSVAPGRVLSPSFDAFLDSAPNPLAPTLRETVDDVLDKSERARFLGHLREMFTTTRPAQRWAGAYLTACVPAGC